jgi:hypothetical protein
MTTETYNDPLKSEYAGILADINILKYQQDQLNKRKVAFAEKASPVKAGRAYKVVGNNPYGVGRHDGEVWLITGVCWCDYGHMNSRPYGRKRLKGGEFGATVSELYWAGDTSGWIDVTDETGGAT